MPRAPSKSYKVHIAKVDALWERDRALEARAAALAEASRFALLAATRERERDARTLERNNAVACQEDAEARLAGLRLDLDNTKRERDTLRDECQRLAGLAEAAFAFALNGGKAPGAE